MNESSLADLIATMGILVLRHGDASAGSGAEAGFEMAGTPPLWYVRLFPEGVQSRAVDVPECFPFLESFLPTAENFWASNAHGRIRSGEWTEELGGNEVPLQASAVVLDGTPLLLVEHVRSDFERIKGILQKARERKLEADTADQIGRTLRRERERHTALRDALPGDVFRLRADGAVLEGVAGARPDAPPHARETFEDEVADELLGAGARALASGKAERFDLPDGRTALAVPVGTSEFWAWLHAPA